LFFPKEIVFDLELELGEVVLVSKTSMDYLWISPLVKKFSSSTSFSITDTKEIDISLFWSGQELDRFYAETGLVDKLDNKKTSLTKQYKNQIWFITGSNFAINVLDPYISSP
jgi:hypothetical protein